MGAKIKTKKRSKKRLGKLSRRKGHQFERETATALRLVFPKARRHLEYQDAEANGCDLVETGAYKFQCKRGRKYASITAIEEVQTSWLGEVPVLVTQADNKKPMAVIPFDCLVALLACEKKLEELE